MTDKQVIIDGVDVSGCEYCGYDNVCRLKSASNYIVDCKDNSNCYYKQLKRKEQECEKIKEDNATLFDKAIEARKECTDLKEQLFLLKIDYAELEKRHNDSIERIQEVIELVESLEGDNCPQTIYFRNKILELLTEGLENGQETS